ncbi:hypothetical protein A7U60_g8399 [Sanghuangporus baumii]|uniref:Rrn7/TAF1B C-terminal cyclin domain-containing protein n=1 Tax=Sanghuangporus baumii TaxID=108892 RepID=A0A9Q5HR23_SANBA|nr:hypothetical protein A7U60_g8399 [Sanghuangporus baumii]
MKRPKVALLDSIQCANGLSSLRGPQLGRGAVLIPSSDVDKVYHGGRARYHYFQCLQVLLRMQIAKLTEIWKLPPDFEIVCRDTWALHLSLLPSPPPPEPFIHAQQHDDDVQKPDFAQKAKSSPREETKKDRNIDEAENVSKSPDTDSSSAPDDEGSDEESPRMDDLMKEASEAEASESDEEDRGRGPSHSQAKGISQRRTGMRWRGDDDSPAATICVLVHSCWLMRIPVIYKDLIRFVCLFLPSLDLMAVPNQPHRNLHITIPGSHTLIPPVIDSTPDKIRETSPLSTSVMLISGVVAVARAVSYSLTHNHLSTSGTVLRTVRNFHTRAECSASTMARASLYAVSKTLAQYLELPLTINRMMAPPLFKQSRRDPTSHKSDNVPPELALVATVIIALKLIYGFDGGKQVTPKEDWDPAHTMPALEVYMDHLQTLATSETKSSRRNLSPPSTPKEDWDPAHTMPALEVYIDHLQTLATSETKSSRRNLSPPSADMPVQTEDEQSLDAYLDFCERALLDRAGRDSKAAGNNDLIGEFYPVLQTCMEANDEGTGSSQSARLGSAGASSRDEVLPVLDAAHLMGDELKAEEAKERKMQRGRESYAMYSGHDELGRVPDIYAIVLSRGVGFCGVSENDLSAVVERFERRIVRLLQRRRDKLEHDIDEEEGE